MIQKSRLEKIRWPFTSGGDKFRGPLSVPVGAGYQLDGAEGQKGI